MRENGGFVSGFLRGAGDYCSVVLPFSRNCLVCLGGGLANYMLTSYKIHHREVDGKANIPTEYNTHPMTCSVLF